MKLYDNLQESIKVVNTSAQNLMLGINALDNVLKGIEPGSVVVIEGRADNGRAEMFNTLICNIAIKQLRPSLILNISTLESEFYNRLFSALTNTDIDIVRKSPADIWAKHSDKLQKTNCDIEFLRFAPIKDIAACIREYAAAGVEIVFIDLFQAIDDDGDNRYCISERCSKLLYSLAKEYKITIILTSNIYPTEERIGGIREKQPSLADLAPFGQLDEFSDVVISLFVPEIYNISEDLQGNDLTGQAFVSIIKNTLNQKLTSVCLYYDAQHFKMENTQLWDA